MSKYIDKQTLVDSTRSLYNDIDDCITDLLKARVSKDTEAEGKALFKMEGLMVATLQQLSCVLDSLQQEQPMPNSTQLIELWHKDKEMLKEKDFRNDPWRLAYNAFMCGFGRGLAVKREQPEVDLEKELNQWRHKHFKGKRDDDYSGEYLERESQLDLARHFWNKGYNARK